MIKCGWWRTCDDNMHLEGGIKYIPFPKPKLWKNVKDDLKNS